MTKASLPGHLSPWLDLVASWRNCRDQLAVRGIAAQWQAADATDIRQCHQLFTELDQAWCAALAKGAVTDRLLAESRAAITLASGKISAASPLQELLQRQLQQLAELEIEGECHA